MNGILFKPEMTQAIIEGRKTQTRRTQGFEEINKNPDEWIKQTAYNDSFGIAGKSTFARQPAWKYNDGIVIIKPRYHIGQKLYIKETYQIFGDHIHYRIDYPHDTVKWKSSMMMPERYARYFIEITDVEPQRLQEITEADAQAEGITSEVNPFNTSPVKLYKNLWESINGYGSWGKNPYVWKYTFKLVK